MAYQTSYRVHIEATGNFQYQGVSGIWGDFYVSGGTDGRYQNDSFLSLSSNETLHITNYAIYAPVNSTIEINWADGDGNKIQELFYFRNSFPGHPVRYSGCDLVSPVGTRLISVTLTGGPQQGDDGFAFIAEGHIREG